jgi:hypothetical protein
MRPTGIRRLLRHGVAPVVAAEQAADKPVQVCGLLMSAAEWNAVPTDWDGSTDNGGSGGSRNGPVVPTPFPKPFVAAT